MLGPKVRDATGRFAVTDMEQRFWSKVERGDGCWLWRGPIRNSRGYGAFSVGGRSVARTLNAHRVAWELTHGTIPDGLFACHQCDNPRCVRPDHMFLGTQSDNIQDSTRKGRHSGFIRGRPGMKGEHHPQAKLTEEDVWQIHALRATGLSTYKIAAQFRVSRYMVSRILRWMNWSHLKPQTTDRSP